MTPFQHSCNSYMQVSFEPCSHNKTQCAFVVQYVTYGISGCASCAVIPVNHVLTPMHIIYAVYYVLCHSVLQKHLILGTLLKLCRCCSYYIMRFLSSIATRKDIESRNLFAATGATESVYCLHAELALKQYVGFFIG